MGWLWTFLLVFIVAMLALPNTPLWFKILFTLVYGVWVILLRLATVRITSDPEVINDRLLARIRGGAAILLTYGTLSLVLTGRLVGPQELGPRQATSIPIAASVTSTPFVSKATAIQATATPTTDDKVLAYRKEADAAMKLGNYRDAAKSLTKAVLLDSTCELCYEMRAICYERTENYNLAVGDFDTAIELDPKNARAYNGRGLAYSYQERFNEAVVDYGIAIALDPSNAVYYLNRGSVYNRQERFQYAVDDLTKAIELGTDSILAQAYYQRAWANHKLGRHRESADDLHRCLDLNPDAELQGLAQEALEALTGD